MLIYTVFGCFYTMDDEKNINIFSGLPPKKTFVCIYKLTKKHF